MQLSRSAAVATLVLLSVLPASAGTCTLSAPTTGALALSSNGLRLGSEEGAAGHSGSLTILSVGSSTLTVAPPVLTQSPAGYVSSSELREVSYSAPITGGTQGYTSSQTSIGVPNLVSAVLMTIHNRITNSAGFAPGTYTTRTVVTCS